MRLSRDTPGAPAPRVRPRRILQFGGGVFMRGFLDWMVDVANEAGAYDGAIAIALSTDASLAERLRAQDMLYTVLVRGLADGREVDTRRIVGSVADIFALEAEWDRAIATISDPALEIVVSNTTEKGIVDDGTTIAAGRTPASFPARFAALLHARWTALGDMPASALLVLPCELIERNGPSLRAIVLAHARRAGFGPGFEAWLDRRVTFLSTLVDRIVPGHPADETARLFAAWGYEDPLAVAVEPFHLFAIEGGPEHARRLPLAEAGLDIVWTDDLRPWRESKVRVLNGGHTATVLAAFLAGHDTVAGMVGDPLFTRFLEGFMAEVLPALPLPLEAARRYADRVLERFANPFVRHELLAISVNSLTKWRIRILPSLRDAVARTGDATPHLAFSLAALLRFARPAPDAPSGAADHAPAAAGAVAMGLRDGGAYPIRDDAALLDRVAAAWTAHGDDPAALASALLGDVALWGEDLRALPGLERRVAASLGDIASHGIREAVARVA